MKGERAQAAPRGNLEGGLSVIPTPHSQETESRGREGARAQALTRELRLLSKGTQGSSQAFVRRLLWGKLSGDSD